jgi:tetratricopeptide (TPR) repeat protein
MKSIFCFIMASLFVFPAYAQTVDEYFSKGNDKFKLQDYNGAISDYDKAIELNPKYAGLYYNRGLAKDNLNDCRGAISDYTRLLS